MARHIPGSYARRKRKSLRWIYIVLALVIIAVLGFVYNPFGKDEGEISETLAETDIKEKAVSPVVMEPKPVPEPEPNFPQIKYDLPSEPNSRVAELIVEAMACINEKPSRVIEARDRLNDLLVMSMGADQLVFIKDQLSELSEQWLFSRTIFPQDNLCGSYEVKPGDLLSTIGRRYMVPYEILMDINRIARPEALKHGEIIKVINGPFHARVYRSIFAMDLYLQDTFVRSFAVGLGKPGTETPTGLLIVEPGGKLIKPTWTDPDTGKTYEAQDPDYPLGSRWIGLQGLKGEATDRTGIAFHGTKDKETIGTASSRGCIRLYNGQVILLYKLLAEGYSQVEIVE